MFPIVIKSNSISSNGRNWPLVVVTRKDLSFPAAVIAQEIYESNWKTDPKNWLDYFTDDGKRKLEILGHEVEVVTANLIYGVDIPSYRNREAYSMVRNYEIFRNCSVVGVETAMLEVNQEAAEWVNNNLKRLRKYK